MPFFRGENRVFPIKSKEKTAKKTKRKTKNNT